MQKGRIGGNLHPSQCRSCCNRYPLCFTGDGHQFKGTILLHEWQDWTQPALREVRHKIDARLPKAIHYPLRKLRIHAE